MRTVLLTFFALSTTIAVDAGTSDTDSGFVGVLLAQQELKLTPAFEGRLVDVRVRIGDTVNAGDLLATLDDRPIRQRLERADADLAEARGSWLEATTRQSRAEQELQTQERLGGEGIVSKETVRAAGDELRIASAGVDQAKARVQQQEARLAQLRDELERTRLLAPFGGTVAERYANPGQNVGTATPIVKLTGSRGLWLRFAIPLEAAGQLRVGKTLRVEVASLGLTTRGEVRQISSEVDPPSGMIIGEASVETPAGWTGQPLRGREVRVFIAVN